jgi:hypothetical protein
MSPSWPATCQRGEREQPGRRRRSTHVRFARTVSRRAETSALAVRFRAESIGGVERGRCAGRGADVAGTGSSAGGCGASATASANRRYEELCEQVRGGVRCALRTCGGSAGSGESSARSAASGPLFAESRRVSEVVIALRDRMKNGLTKVVGAPTLLCRRGAGSAAVSNPSAAASGSSSIGAELARGATKSRPGGAAEMKSGAMDGAPLAEARSFDSVRSLESGQLADAGQAAGADAGIAGSNAGSGAVCFGKAGAPAVGASDGTVNGPAGCGLDAESRWGGAVVGAGASGS